MKGETGPAEKEGILAAIARAKESSGANSILRATLSHDDFVASPISRETAPAFGEAGTTRRPLHRFLLRSFMAETAGILCRPDQEVFHPEPAASCGLADMASLDQVEAAWRGLAALHKDIVPVVYVNSNADLKAFCGRHGGAVCTSANVGRIFTHVLKRGASLFFFPDGNMGRNISRDLGIADGEIAVWSPRAAAWEGEPGRAKVLLWDGCCSVHQAIRPEDVLAARRAHAGIRVIVHPECTPEVYRLADAAGSTNVISKAVAESGEGSAWAIGTEWNFVNRIARENPG
jgi:quinolinate synthase